MLFSSLEGFTPAAWPFAIWLEVEHFVDAPQPYMRSVTTLGAGTDGGVTSPKFRVQNLGNGTL